MSETEERLLQLAEAELLEEARRAEIRYSVSGPSGWNPCPLAKTNKRFLVNTLKSTVASNRLKERDRKSPERRPVERKLFKGRKSHGYCEDNIVFRSPVKKSTKEPKKPDSIRHGVTRESGKDYFKSTKRKERSKKDRQNNIMDRISPEIIETIEVD